MRSEYKYPVVFIKKVPIISDLLKVLLIVCLCIFAYAYLLYVPSTRSGNEMKTAILFDKTPKTTIWFIFYCTIAIPPLFYLYRLIRIRKRGYVCFNENEIVLIEKDKLHYLEISEVDRLIINEPNYYSYEVFKPKLFFTIQLNNEKVIRFKLRYFEHSDEVVDYFLSYERIKNRVLENNYSMDTY